ncbi:glycosyltransferase family 2 protein [Haloferacaceae archaeon DSL9]
MAVEQYETEDESLSAEQAHQSDSSTVLVGIPAYNEEVGIGSTVLATKQFADEVVVADDGSSDNTVQIAKDAGATVLEHEVNRGKGGAVRTLFQHARTTDIDALVLIDGDGQHVPADIPDVVQPVLDGQSDVVIGSRYLENGATETPAYRRVGQRTLDLLTMGSVKSELTDTQSGFRAFSAEAVDSLDLRTDGFGVESEMITDAKSKNLELTEVSIDVRYDGIDGQTLNPLQHGLTVTAFILQLVRDRHPLLFFGVPGLILTLFGLFYGLNAITVYQTSGVFYPSSGLVAGFATIIGVLGIFCGLILNRISNMINELYGVHV